MYMYLYPLITSGLTGSSIPTIPIRVKSDTTSFSFSQSIAGFKTVIPESSNETDDSDTSL